ncbi:ABC transporter ATP-binding protein [Paenibacillus graminis]|uniref:Multidrug ABC transporter ATP-binding protein n=1 Tax=Paenibacillus graminis TaxID=189425 RepID=A0A089MCQ0_9BACL|nr:ABC transporter ATP-binding protein [Paenibacillus graminis]AIQ69263.1 multidrug ABC transporter ATP-binding protein [Paenibacillus graminis]
MKQWKSYYTFVRPYMKWIVLTLFIGMIKFSIPLTLPLILKYVVDDLLNNPALTAPERVSKLMTVLGGSLVLFVIIRGPVEYYRQYFAQLITSRVLFDMRNRLYGHLQRLSLRYYQNTKVGEAISRFINDVEQSKNLVEVGMMNVWLDMFTLVFALAFMFYLNPVLALVSIAILPLYGIAVNTLYKRLKLLTKDRSQALAAIQGYLHERIQGIAIIRSFTMERVDKKQFKDINGRFLEKAMAQTRWNAFTFAIINTLTDIAPLLVIGYGGYQVIHGNLSLGTFVAFFGYLDRMYAPLRRLINSSTVLTQASASLERVMELLDEPYDIIDEPGAKPLAAPAGAIEFQKVWFKYNDENDWVLKNIELSIEPGQTVAFVGMSGGGKSSLISLIPRFYDITEGSLRMDGQDVRTLTQESLRRAVGMVLQDNFLFSGSVRDNILFGNPEAGEPEIIAAAQAANAHDFIMQLPEGYDTEVGERGVKLSGGQKQRVAIARVFLKDPKVLILDEATSALDLESEHLIQQALQSLASERTTLIVAHRLSTITHADQIVVLEHGEITERGTHEKLMALDGSYARLFNVQRLDSKKVNHLEASEDQFLRKN